MGDEVDAGTAATKAVPGSGGTRATGGRRVGLGLVGGVMGVMGNWGPGASILLWISHS